MQELSTAAGVGHGHKYNEAGQPVFEYLPEEHTAPSNTQRTHRQTTTTTATGQWPNAQAENDQLDDSPSNDETPGKAETRNPDELRNLWARVRARHPEPLAEFLATGMALFLGLASTLSVNLSANQPTSYGNFETSCWAWGFAWMFGIYLGGGVSGAHMNPAISICLSLFRGFPWSQCGIYLAVHFLATLSAAALAYGIYADSIHHLDPSLDSMSQTFFSTPQEWVSFPSAFLSQMVGSAVMMIAVFALGDDQNNPPGAGMHAFVLGLLVTTLKFALGFNGAAALNPASDFGPRVIAYAVGYRDPKVFATGWWLYGPWLGTLAGSMLGCIIYDGCIFVGSESPVNYRMSPTFKSIGKRVTKWRKSVRN
jgi:aquaglyceroporin related protein